jgi:multiple sugar transport system permease protein
MNRVGASTPYKIAVWGILISGAILMIIPFLWLVSSAFKLKSNIWLFPPQWIPDPVVVGNFTRALTVLPFGLYLRNTTFIVVVHIIEAIVISSLCGYGFARIRFFGREVIFMMLLATMMIPHTVLMIPQYVMFRVLGWIDTYLVFLIPPIFAAGGGGFASGPFFVFLVRQFFRTIPNDLSDAAKIDGCNHFGIYWRVMLPLVTPALATIAVFSFLNSWNDFMGPLMYLISPDKRTVALGLQYFRSAYMTEWNLLMAASTAMTIPVVIVFFFAQRYFVEGAVISGIKG